MIKFNEYFKNMPGSCTIKRTERSLKLLNSGLMHAYILMFIHCQSQSCINANSLEVKEQIEQKPPPPLPFSVSKESCLTSPVLGHLSINPTFLSCSLESDIHHDEKQKQKTHMVMQSREYLALHANRTDKGAANFRFHQDKPHGSVLSIIGHIIFGSGIG